MKRFVFISLVSAGLLSLSACTSVKLPSFSDSPDFQAVSGTVGDYPNPAAAPQAPTDIRTHQAWDQAATDLLNKQKAFDVPDDKKGKMTEAQINREIRSLKEKVREYKLDDPQK